MKILQVFLRTFEIIFILKIFWKYFSLYVFWQILIFFIYRRKAAEEPVLDCKVCSDEFESRTKLFQHIKEVSFFVLFIDDAILTDEQTSHA